MPKITRNTVILAKTEATVGTDAVPGADDAIQAGNLTLSPLAADFVDREFFTSAMGHQPQLVTNRRVEISFDVEVSTPQDASAPDIVPAWAPLVGACGFEQTVSAGASVSYEPVSAGHGAVTIYCYLDGTVQKIAGCRGSFSLTLSPGGVPVFSFTFTGVYAGLSDAANPAANLTAFKPPVAVDSSNASLTLHGTAVVASELTFDVANNVVAADLIGGNEIYIGDRAPVGSVTFDLTPTATKDWVGIAAAQTPGTLDFTLGGSTGYYFDVDAPKVVLGQPVIGDRDGIRTIQLPLRLTPNAGNDELALTTR